MRTSLSTLLACVLALCLPAAAGAAEGERKSSTYGPFEAPLPAADAVTPEDWLLSRVQSFLRAGKGASEVKARLMEIFYRADLDGGGVSATDVELAEEIAAAQRRAAQAMRWLASDLDSDGVLTRAELEATLGARAHEPLRSGGSLVPPTEEQAAEILKDLVSKAMRLDTDGDGTITIKEMLVPQENGLRIPAGRPDQQLPSGLDANKDGVIARDEFAAAADRGIASVDTDADGLFSDEEVAAFTVRQGKINRAVQTEMSAKQAASVLEQQVKQCAYPPVPSGAKIALVMTYGGDALSTVALGNEDTEVSFAEVTIEPGPDPLYLVLGSLEGMIWRISGDVGRLKHVVASAWGTPEPGQVPRVGVVGIPREQIHVLPSTQCLPYFAEREATRAAKTLGLLSAALGRKADTVLFVENVHKVAVPSGKRDDATPHADAEAITEKEGPAKAIWQELLRYQPGGVVRIQPDAVVSRVTPIQHSVLPQEAGLAQLVESGALRAAGDQLSVIFGKTQIIGSGGADKIIVPEGVMPVFRKRSTEFVILKKMRFPAGLNGAHSVRFLLAPGVPQPDGDPGHSCLLDQETGKQLSRTGC